MQIMIPFEPGRFYHVFGRGINRQKIFFEERNYPYFLRLVQREVLPVARLYAYCLLPNHFHLLIRARIRRAAGAGCGNRSKGLLRPRDVSLAFNRLLVAYVKGVNKAYGRVGGLFQHHFGRKPVDNDDYFLTLVQYIHWNPVRCGLTARPRDWPYSSCPNLLSAGATNMERAAVHAWFGGRSRFVSACRTAPGSMEGDRFSFFGL